MPRARAGAVLIVVAGLASILLVLAVTFMARMRSDGQETRIVIAETQARLMMHAALMYLQECSRIGWGDATGESFGWTDVRDGGLGPRGQRPAGASGDGSAVPAPEWWTRHAGWPVFKWDADDADLPEVSQRRGGWPLPGTATRCPMAVCQVPPYATQLTACYNPVQYPDTYGSATWETAWNTVAPPAGNITHPNTRYSNYVMWPTAWIDRIFSSGTGMLDPQPVLDRWSDFRNGRVDPSALGGDWTHERFDASGNPVAGALQQLAVVPGTENTSWFRIYRELQVDHDCRDNVGKPGTLWWDRVALYDPTPTIAPDPTTPPARMLHNWNVFIVACGSGGTRGYRFWDDAAIAEWETDTGLPAGTGRALEPVTAQESGLFTSQDDFESMLATSRILWFRCEWSGLEAGARTMAIYNDPLWTVKPWQDDGTILAAGRFLAPGELDQQFHPQYATTDVRAFGGLDSSGPDQSDTRTNSPKIYAGNIKWLQRLDRDPVLW
jgi:hypothetical protein